MKLSKLSGFAQEQIVFGPFSGQLNPQAPVAQKSADEVVFPNFQGEGVEFF